MTQKFEKQIFKGLQFARNVDSREVLDLFPVDKRDVPCESVVHKYVNSNQQVTIARSKTSQNEESLPTSSRTLLPACKGVVLYCVIFPGIAYDSHLLSVY